MRSINLQMQIINAIKFKRLLTFEDFIKMRFEIKYSFDIIINGIIFKTIFRDPNGPVTIFRSNVVQGTSQSPRNRAQPSRTFKNNMTFHS